jgi:hypothetical protein
MMFVDAPETMFILCKEGESLREEEEKNAWFARLLGFCVIFSTAPSYPLLFKH